MTTATEQLEANKKIARDYIDQVFNQHNPGNAADFVTSDVVWHGNSLAALVIGVSADQQGSQPLYRPCRDIPQSSVSFVGFLWGSPLERGVVGILWGPGECECSARHPV